MMDESLSTCSYVYMHKAGCPVFAGFHPVVGMGGGSQIFFCTSLDETLVWVVQSLSAAYEYGYSNYYR